MKKNSYHVYYIKLGTGNQPKITKTCLENALLYMSFKGVPECAVQEALENERKNPVHGSSAYDYKEDWEPVRKTAGGANDSVNATVASSLRKFYTATEDDYFFTFHNSTMYYCHPIGPVIPVTKEYRPFTCFEEGTRLRQSTEWRNVSETDEPKTLSEYRLSGRLNKYKMYRGTICELKGKDLETFKNYLAWNFPEYDEFVALNEQQRDLIIDRIKELNPADFEVFVDMLFTKSGWDRVGELGGKQKAIDMEYYNPIEKKTIYVQVKGELKSDKVNGFLEELHKHLRGEEEPTCYLVYHTYKGKQQVPEKYEHLRIKTQNAEALAELCMGHQEVVNWLFLKTTGRY